jgi:hypothetical protein
MLQGLDSEIDAYKHRDVADGVCNKVQQSKMLDDHAF